VTAPRDAQPLAVHLSSRRLANARTIARFLRAANTSRRIDSKLLAAFRFRNDERSFARRLVRRKPNLWLFRSNQRCFCGDFVVVDMSSPSPERRRVFVVDLKWGADLKLGGGGASNQFTNAALAVDQIARRTGVVEPGAEFTLVSGDKLAVLEYLCAIC